MKKENSKIVQLQQIDILKVSAGAMSFKPAGYSGIEDNLRLTPRFPSPKKPIPGF
ncbi:hypothetical protein [Salinimonas iocasae]|uniref:hypothetical protein n=1 Tax=Salinimonas iocasae TaxID=2572577 RepID=UPI00143D4E8E|nr:hypothetical protein [Salinimonas iocasae]